MTHDLPLHCGRVCVCVRASQTVVAAVAALSPVLAAAVQQLLAQAARRIENLTREKAACNQLAAEVPFFLLSLAFGLVATASGVRLVCICCDLCPVAWI